MARLNINVKIRRQSRQFGRGVAIAARDLGWRLKNAASAASRALKSPSPVERTVPETWRPEWPYLRWSLAFLCVAVIAAVVGFTGFAYGAAFVAQAAFFISAGLAVTYFILALTRGRP